LSKIFAIIVVSRRRRLDVNNYVRLLNDRFAYYANIPPTETASSGERRPTTSTIIVRRRQLLRTFVVVSRKEPPFDEMVRRLISTLQ
jgi:hypothetical protein